MPSSHYDYIDVPQGFNMSQSIPNPGGDYMDMGPTSQPEPPTYLEPRPRPQTALYVNSAHTANNASQPELSGVGISSGTYTDLSRRDQDRPSTYTELQPQRIHPERQYLTLADNGRTPRADYMDLGLRDDNEPA